MKPCHLILMFKAFLTDVNLSKIICKLLVTQVAPWPKLPQLTTWMVGWPLFSRAIIMVGWVCSLFKTAENGIGHHLIKLKNIWRKWESLLVIALIKSFTNDLWLFPLPMTYSLILSPVLKAIIVLLGPEKQNVIHALVPLVFVSLTILKLKAV